MMVVGAFKDLFIVGKECLTQIRAFTGTPIPKFDEDTLLRLVQDSTAFLRRIPTVVEIEAPVHIIGDINGNIVDLIRVITAKGGSFSTERYVFLGNYIGRGVFSIQCLALLLAMFCLCPQNVILLRGVNEFEENSSLLAFEDELREDYGPNTTLHEQFQELFANLPLAGLIEKQILCVHGGITKNVKTVAQIATIARPSYTLNDPILSDITSAKANPAKGEYIDSSMDFDENILKQFLAENELRKLVRGHECVPKGIASSAGGKVITVFSCSNFEGRKNRAGMIYVSEEKECRGIAIGAVRLPKRATAEWMVVSPPKKERTCNPRVFRQPQIARGVKRRPSPSGFLFQEFVTQTSRARAVTMNPARARCSSGENTSRDQPVGHIAHSYSGGLEQGMLALGSHLNLDQSDQDV